MDIRRLNVIQQWLANGSPVAYGSVTCYVSGTMTKAVIYADHLGTQQANPVNLDWSGRAVIYLQAGQGVDIVVHDQPNGKGNTVTTQARLRTVIGNTFSFNDENGQPLAHGSVVVLDNKTQDLATVYTDYTGSVELPNPVALDSNGEADIYAEAGILYDIRAFDLANGRGQLKYERKGIGGIVLLGGVGYEVGTGSGDPIQLLAVSPSSWDFEDTGDTKQFSPTFDNPLGNPADCTWASSDEDVATIDSDGLATAVGVNPGETISNATITCTYFGQTATASVTFALALRSVSPDTYDFEGPYGATQQIDAIFNDGNTYNDLPTWSSTDEDVVTVVDGLVTSVGPGSADVLCVYGETSLTIPVTVGSAYSLEYLDEAEISMLTVDGSSGASTYQLNPVFSDAGDHKAACTWSSSNTGAVTVSASGLCTAVGAGDATITCLYSGVSKTCLVTGYTTMPSLATLKTKKGGAASSTSVTFAAANAPTGLGVNYDGRYQYMAMDYVITASSVVAWWLKPATTGAGAVEVQTASSGGQGIVMPVVISDVGTDTRYFGSTKFTAGTTQAITIQLKGSPPTGAAFLVNGTSQTTSTGSTTQAAVAYPELVWFANTANGHTRKGCIACVSDSSQTVATASGFGWVAQDYIRYSDITSVRTNYTKIPNRGTLGSTYDLTANNVPAGWFGV